MTATATITNTASGTTPASQSQTTGKLSLSKSAWAGAVAESFQPSSSSAPGVGRSGFNEDATSALDKSTEGTSTKSTTGIPGATAVAVLSATLPSSLTADLVSGGSSEDATASQDHSSIGISAAKIVPDLKAQTLVDLTDASNGTHSTSSTKKTKLEAAETRADQTPDQISITSVQVTVAPEVAAQVTAQAVSAQQDAAPAVPTESSTTTQAHGASEAPASLSGGRTVLASLSGGSEKQSATSLSALAADASTSLIQDKSTPAAQVPHTATATLVGADDNSVAGQAVASIQNQQQMDTIPLPTGVERSSEAATESAALANSTNHSVGTTSLDSTAASSMANTGLATSAAASPSEEQSSTAQPGVSALGSHMPTTHSAVNGLNGSATSAATLSTPAHAHSVSAGQTATPPQSQMLAESPGTVSLSAAAGSNGLEASGGLVDAASAQATTSSTAASKAVSAVSSSSERSVKPSMTKSTRAANSVEEAQYTSQQATGHSTGTVVEASALGNQLANARDTSAFTTSSGSDKPGSTLSDTFAALDSDATKATPTWVHRGAQSAEAGYQDPTLGWVSVRADASSGGVHAVLVPSSADAAQALGGHLAGLNAYMAEHHSTVSPVTVASSEGQSSLSSMDQGSSQNMHQGAGQSANQDAGQNTALYPQLNTPTYESGRAITNSTIQTGTTDGIAPTSTSGVHISLIA